MAFSSSTRMSLLICVACVLGWSPSSHADDEAPPALVPRAPTPVATPCWAEGGEPATPEHVFRLVDETTDPVQVARCLSPLLLDTVLRDALLVALNFAAHRALGQDNGPLFGEALFGGWESVAPTQSLPPIAFSGGPWRLVKQIEELLSKVGELETARDVRSNIEHKLIPLLGRCGGSAAIAWLEHRSGTPGLEAATIQTLAQIGKGDAHAALVRIAGRGNGERRALAVAALALNGAANTVALPMPEASTPYGWAMAYASASKGMGPDRQGASTDDRRFEMDWALYAADFMAQQGKREQAVTILRDVLTNAAEGRQRRAALQQLARVSPDDARGPAISLAQDRLVGPDARAILAADPQAAPEIRRAYAQGEIGLKTALLEVAARHEDEALRSLLTDAASSPSPTLRFLSASLSGQEPSPQDALDTAEMGPHWLQHRALRALLDSFHGEAIAGDKKVAAQGFRALADSDAPMWCRAEALEGLGRIGTMEDLPFLEHYRPHAELGRAASTALARIAAQATEAGEATATLNVLRETTGFQEAVEAAAAVMVARGVAGQDIALAQGYVTQWDILGPFRRVMSLPPFLPPSTSDPPSVIASGEEEFRWKSVESTGIPACVQVDPERGTATYFAYTEIVVSAFESVRMEVRAAGPWRLWINGEALGEGEAASPESRYAPHAAGLLNPGINRVLLQFLSEHAPSQYCIRVLNRRGQPIDLLAQQMPDSGAAQVGVGRSAAESILDATP